MEASDAKGRLALQPTDDGPIGAHVEHNGVFLRFTMICDTSALQS
jgi:hypothetical protein